MLMMQPGSVLQAIDIGSVAHNVIEGIKDFEHPVLTGRGMDAATMQSSCAPAAGPSRQH